MIEVERRLAEMGDKLGRPAGRIILHIHDELLLEVDARAVREVAAVVKEAMETAVTLDVPFPVTLQTGRSWGELSELNLSRNPD
jgi:DNA polymerase I-like protein with 3'-5' exonuclease and polymerase domains